MTTISQQYLELTLVILLLCIVLFTMFTLYRKNSTLYRLNVELKSKLKALGEENSSLKAKNSQLIQNQQRLLELERLSQKYYELTGQYTILQEKHEELEKEFKDATLKLQQLQLLQSKTQSLQEALESKREVLTKLQEQMASEFKALSSELLEKKSQNLQQRSKEQMKLLLEPFEGELKNFKTRLEQMHENQYQSLASLRGEILQIKALNNTLAQEANALTKALKGESKLQGNWGELILEKALESCGLREGVEYKREQSFKNGDSKLRADVVLYLPENRHIVIDAKVSLTHYSEVVKAKEQEMAKLAKKAHIMSMKRHIDTLATKQYHLLNELRAPEFTLMFVPIEAAYLLALESDSNLFEYAFERNVAVVTPTTLLTTLKTVSSLWKLANHDKNMQKLAQEAALMHDKFVLFLEEFLALEQRLNQAATAYGSAKTRLISGQGNLFSRIERVGKLSGKTKKNLPSLEKIDGF